MLKLVVFIRAFIHGTKHVFFVMNFFAWLKWYIFIQLWFIMPHIGYINITYFVCW